MSNWIAEAHNDWHTVARMEGTNEALCPWDCGMYEAEAEAEALRDEYLAALEAEAEGLDALAAEFTPEVLDALEAREDVERPRLTALLDESDPWAAAFNEPPPL